VLVSHRLIAEYRAQIPTPRNDHVRAFFELLAAPPGRAVVWNWKTPWSGADREKAHRRCGFPKEDVHVLRTAIRTRRSFLVTEEQGILNTDKCIYRAFRVHIRHPRSV